MKFVLAVVILLLVYLFFPFRELYVQEDPFSANYRLVSRGFWSDDACIEAAQAQQAERYQCRKRTTFSRMFHTAQDYGHGQ